MDTVAPRQMLYPAFAMFLLAAIVLARLARLRLAAVGRGEMKAAFYRTFQGGEEPDEIRVTTRNFINQFEVPVLFYVGLILTYVTQQVSYWMIVCAWLYVALRYVHSYVHLTSNDVLLRFRLYFGSGIVLVVMWTSLFIKLVR
jgi:hypothetical protein